MVRPDKGTYEFSEVNTGANPWKGVFVVLESGEPTSVFVAQSGTLKINESNAGRLRGTFTFSAEGYLNDDPLTSIRIDATGTFDAAKASASATMTAAIR